MVTKMVIKKIKNMKYIQLFEIPILCFLCFVLLDTSGRYAGTPNAFIFSLNNYERLAPFVSKVMTEKKKQGNSQAFTFWSKV